MLVMLVLAVGGFLLFLGTRSHTRRRLEVRRLRRSVARKPGTDPQLTVDTEASTGEEKDPGTPTDEDAPITEDTADDEVRPRPLERRDADGDEH